MKTSIIKGLRRFGRGGKISVNVRPHPGPISCEEEIQNFHFQRMLRVSKKLVIPRCNGAEMNHATQKSENKKALRFPFGLD